VYLYVATLGMLLLVPPVGESARELAARGGWGVLAANALPPGRWFEPRAMVVPAVPVVAGSALVEAR